MKQQKLHVLAYRWQPDNKREIEEALNDAYRITYEDDPHTFRLKLGMDNHDVLILEIESENDPTLDLFREIRSDMPSTPVIVACESEQPKLVAEIIHTGVSDYIRSPWQPERIRHAVEKTVAFNSRVNELAYLRRTQDVVYNFDDVVAETPAFRAIIDNLRKFAAFDSTILFIGEIGTGKGFLAGTVHFNSPRRAAPFIKISCTNMSEQLLESELFGHEPGAFPGADKQRVGRLEQANGGTVFLDEISSLSLRLQGKLLRFLEDKSFERVGGTRTISVNVRIISATHRDLIELIASGSFREDLYYRLNVLPVHLPPLKDRPDCIVPLAQKLLANISTRVCKPVRGFADEALRLLARYHWPGNILQLGNVIERAVILEENELIRPISLRGGDALAPHDPASARNIPELADSECALLLRALKESDWVQKKAALKLGISPRVINYKIKKYGITHPRWRKQKNKINLWDARIGLWDVEESVAETVEESAETRQAPAKRGGRRKGAAGKVAAGKVAAGKVAPKRRSSTSRRGAKKATETARNDEQPVAKPVVKRRPAATKKRDAAPESETTGNE